MNKQVNRLFSLLLLGGILLAACSSGSETAGEATAPAATIAPAATDVPATATVAVVVAATAGSDPTDEPAMAEATATTQASPTEATETMTEVEVNGRNADGTYFRGRADAPVVLVDYSDFF